MLDSIVNLPGFPQEARERIKMKDDEINAVILAGYEAAYLAHTEPRAGDWVIFSDGTERRISHVWKDYVLKEGGNENEGRDWIDSGKLENYSIQTSQPFGGYFLGNGYISYSGSLYIGISGDELKATGELKRGRVWIWNRGHSGAGRGRTYEINCKVWQADCQPPKV